MNLQHFENLQASQILLYEKMLLLTTTVSLLWILVLVADLLTVKGAIYSGGLVGKLNRKMLQY